MASLRVDDGHVACLGELANQLFELPHLHSLVALPTYTACEGRFALHAGLAQLKALRAEQGSSIDSILFRYPSIEALSLASPSVLPRCLPSTALPDLRKITTHTRTLALLVPDRPVKNVVLTAPCPMTRVNERVSELRRQLEELAAEGRYKVSRCAYALTHSTDPVRRLLAHQIGIQNW